MEGYRSGHNGAVLKTVWGQPRKGSNPLPSVLEKPVISTVTGFFLFFLVKLKMETFNFLAAVCRPNITIMLRVHDLEAFAIQSTLF